MKNLDIKKLLVFIVIIAVIALIVVFGIKQLFGENTPPEEETKKVEELVTDYFANLYEGYTTSYNGIDLLYKNDKTTIDDLEDKQILNMAINYATSKSMNIGVSSITYNQLKKIESLGNIDNYLIFNAAGIRDAAKEIFGIELEDKNEISEYSYLYDFIYVYEYDVYLLKRNTTEDITNKDRAVELSVIKTTKKNNEVMTTVAVAYTNKSGDKKDYAKDSQGEEIVAENSEEFPTNNINDFEKYTFTLTQTDDGDYTFKSVEKVN